MRSAGLGVASAAVVAASGVWAWATFDFWETVPLVPCLLGAGLLASLAVYDRGRKFVVALLVGLVVTGAAFCITGLVTLYRWEG